MGKRKMMEVGIGSLSLRSPVIMMSGIFSYGEIEVDYIDYSKIGAIITKTITLNPREGNPQPRIWEAGSGMINCIGLQNPGIKVFAETSLKEIVSHGADVIVSISGHNGGEAVEMTGELARRGVKAVEINLSCPNIDREKLMVSQSAEKTFRLINDVKSRFKDITVIAKLSPNVTSIAEIAEAAERGGADALSLINTVKGLCVDIENRRVVEGGLSGPPVKPIGLKAVYDVFPEAGIPIIGMGGIHNGRDALEYMLCGASAVGVGSGFFSNPNLPEEVYDTLREFLVENGFDQVRDIAGLLNEKRKKPSSGKKKRG